MSLGGAEVGLEVSKWVGGGAEVGLGAPKWVWGLRWVWGPQKWILGGI